MTGPQARPIESRSAAPQGLCIPPHALASLMGKTPASGARSRCVKVLYGTWPRCCIERAGFALPRLSLCRGRGRRLSHKAGSRWHRAGMSLYRFACHRTSRSSTAAAPLLFCLVSDRLSRRDRGSVLARVQILKMGEGNRHVERLESPGQFDNGAHRPHSRFDNREVKP